MALDLAQAIAKHQQRPLRGDPGIELTQAARCRVARIDKNLLATRTLSLVEFCEAFFRHKDLTAYLEHRRPVFATQAQWDRVDGAHVLGHVLTAGAVPARGRLHQKTLLVTRTDRQTVELGLGSIGHITAVLR